MYWPTLNSDNKEAKTEKRTSLFCDASDTTDFWRKEERNLFSLGRKINPQCWCCEVWIVGGWLESDIIFLEFGQFDSLSALRSQKYWISNMASVKSPDRAYKFPNFQGTRLTNRNQELANLHLAAQKDHVNIYLSTIRAPS